MKSRYLRAIAIVFALIFLITSALFLVKLWERKNGEFPAFHPENSTLEYEGEKYVRRDRIETFLVLGLDKYEDAISAESHESGVQTDFLMLFVFDNEAKQCTAVHINRDTMTRVNRLSVGGTSVVDTYTKQIALAYNYANVANDKICCGNTRDSVEYLLKNVKVDHYMSMTMEAVSILTDLVGGVEVEIKDDFTGVDDTLIMGETVTLNGEAALRYVRARGGLIDSSNIARMGRQRQYVCALYDKAVSCMEADDQFILKLVDKLGEHIVYDSSSQRMQSFAEKFGEYEFLGIREIDGEAKTGEEYMEFYPDEDAITKLVVELFYTPKEK